jgi:hypothetical protein
MRTTCNLIRMACDGNRSRLSVQCSNRKAFPETSRDEPAPDQASRAGDQHGPAAHANSSPTSRLGGRANVGPSRSIRGPVAGASSALTVLRLPDRQHRAGGQTDHPLCDAAQQKVVEPGSAVCAHDDQVRALFLRDLDDLFERYPRLDAAARLDPPLAEIVARASSASSDHFRCAS